MTITQSAITITAPIRVGHEAALQSLLEELGQDPAGNPVAPFGKFPNVHFARFFVLHETYDVYGHYLEPRLVFLADVDGSADAFVRRFAMDSIDRVFAHCVGYPASPARLDYLRAHTVQTAASYVNTVGRTVQQIRQEAALREAIQHFLDRTASQWRGAAPWRVRAAVQEFVAAEPALAWARTPFGPEPTFVLAERVHFLLVVGAVIVLLPVVLLGLPIFLWLLRRHEQTDVARDVIPDDARIQALAAQEDHGVQNPFTSAGLLKPGRFRRFTASVVLYGTNFLARHIFNRADLIGVKTIHFGRWIFLDDKRRVIFASNYDGSLENYMDDFVDKIAWGLNITFSNGVDYPKTNWLVLDGARDEQVFKRFNLMHQLAAPFWYAGYQGLTALNIENNARIRAGLYGDMDDTATRAWLARF
jgi:hypothetical protein